MILNCSSITLIIKSTFCSVLKFLLEVCISVNFYICQVNTAQRNTLVHNIVAKKCAKFGAKIFRHFWDIAIFVLGYFILPHPVYFHCFLLTPFKSVRDDKSISLISNTAYCNSASSSNLDIFNRLYEGLLTGNQMQHCALDGVKLRGVNERIGADVDKWETPAHSTCFHGRSSLNQ